MKSMTGYVKAKENSKATCYKLVGSYPFNFNIINILIYNIPIAYMYYVASYIDYTILSLSKLSYLLTKTPSMPETQNINLLKQCCLVKLVL